MIISDPVFTIPFVVFFKFVSLCRETLLARDSDNITVKYENIRY